MAQWKLFDVVDSAFLKFAAVLKFRWWFVISHSKNIRMSTLITTIITY